MLIKDLIKVSTRDTLFVIKDGPGIYEGYTNNIPFKFWDLKVLKIGTSEKGIVVECEPED